MDIHPLFIKELKHWGFHISVIATPGFLLALQSGYNTWGGISAMILSLAIYILLYAALGYLQSPYHRTSCMGMAVLLATRVRTSLAFLGILGSVSNHFQLLMLPDLISGSLAIAVLGKSPIPSFSGDDSPHNFRPFVDTFATSMFAGFFVSGGLLLLTLVIYGSFRFYHVNAHRMDPINSRHP